MLIGNRESLDRDPLNLILKMPVFKVSSILGGLLPVIGKRVRRRVLHNMDN
jgi:hypothetical protein